MTFQSSQICISVQEFSLNFLKYFCSEVLTDIRPDTSRSCLINGGADAGHLYPQPPQPLGSEGNKEAFMAVIMILLERSRLLFMPCLVGQLIVV